MAHVFISYVRENKAQIEALYRGLREAGVDVWLDRHKIAPGTRWRRAIRQAIREGSFFIACFSREYRTRESSYMNEELALAIEELRKRHPDRTWFIPVLLSKCDIPDFEIGGGGTLPAIQWIDLGEDWDAGVKRLIHTIRTSMRPSSANRKGAASAAIQPPPQGGSADGTLPGGLVRSSALVRVLVRVLTLRRIGIVIAVVVAISAFVYRHIRTTAWPRAAIEQGYRVDTRWQNGTIMRMPTKALYEHGEIVTLLAVPAAGYRFAGWSGDLVGTNNPGRLTVNSNKSVTANFVPDASLDANSYPTVMDGNKSVRASFAAESYMLITSATNGSVIKDPDQPRYSRGQAVTLRAVPDAGYRFTGWSGDLSGTSNPATLVMDGNKSVTAGSAADGEGSGSGP